MDFQDFLKLVPQISLAALPGKEAHALMAHKERIAAFENIDFEKITPRNAAVLVLLYPKNGQTHLVLIVRNLYEGVHSGQISFPGGKHEPEDLDFAQTALRETHEEVGVNPETVTIIKELTSIYIPPSNFMVYPFLALSKTEISFVPDATEVDTIIELPLAVFLDDKILVDLKMTTSYAHEIEVPAFAIQNQKVWGATAMVLSELKMILKNGSVTTRC